MASLLLTGGSGLLALNWARAVAREWSVHLALNERTIVFEGATGHQVDLGSASGFGQLLDQLRPDLVVHAAGLTDVERCERAPEQAHEVNVVCAGVVARSCAEHGIKLVHISTDHLFDGALAMATEEDLPQPLNEYGRSKAAGEQMVLASAPSAMVVRTNFYGWGPSYRRSFSDRILDALRRGDSISLFEDVHFTPILADALIDTVHALAATDASGIYNVTGDERLSKYDFGLRIADVFGLDGNLIRPGRLTDRVELTRRPQEMSLCNRKARDRLGHVLGNVSDHLERLAQLETDPLVKKVQHL